MNMYFYSLKYYDDGREWDSHGMVCGKDYIEAVSNLLEYFGEDDVTQFELEWCADRPIAIFPDDKLVPYNYKYFKDAIMEENNV